MRNADVALDNEIETVSDACFSHLVQHPEDLQRFMAETGYGPETISGALGTRALALAMIEHVTKSESLLLTISANAGIAPERVTALWHKLNPGT